MYSTWDGKEDWTGLRGRHCQSVSQFVGQNTDSNVGNLGLLSFFTTAKCPFHKGRNGNRERVRKRKRENEAKRNEHNGCQKPKRHETFYATLGNCLEN